MMDVKKVIKYWTKTAEDDFRVAQHLLKAKDYTYCLFFGHLVIEKLLKACIVKQTQAQAPYSHNLIYLAEKAGLQLSDKQMDLLESISKYNIEARYPDIKHSLQKKTTKRYTTAEFKKIKGIIEWLKKKLQD